MIGFIDVSGTPYNANNKTAWVSANAICIRKRAIYEITATMHRLKRDILNSEFIELKATDLVNKSTLSHPNLDKFQYLQGVVDFCLSHKDCRHAAIVFSNIGQSKKSETNRLPRHYVDLLWRIEAIARDYGSLETETLVIIDNNAPKADKHLALAFNNYLYRSLGGEHLAKILPIPIFAVSETTAGIQLADIAAGIMRNYYTLRLNERPEEETDTPFERKLREYHAIIMARSVNRRIGRFSVNGVFVADSSYTVL